MVGQTTGNNMNINRLMGTFLIITTLGGWSWLLTAGPARPHHKTLKCLGGLSPVDASVVVVSVEELDLLERLLAGVVTGQVRVHTEEQVQCCCTWEGEGKMSGVYRRECAHHMSCVKATLYSYEYIFFQRERDNRNFIQCNENTTRRLSSELNEKPCVNFQLCPVGGVEALRLTCLLRPDDKQFGEAVTCFLFGPDVLVPFVLTGIL